MMKFSTLSFLSIIVAAVQAQTAGPYDPCYLCGDMSAVPANTDTDIPMANLTCGEAYNAGLGGFLEPTSCATLKSAAGDLCGCPAPPCQGPGCYPQCFICGLPNETIAEPDNELTGFNRTCIEADAAGYYGATSPAQCTLIQQFAGNFCGECVERHPVCPLCGDLQVTPNETDLLLPLPGQNQTCGEIDFAGRLGYTTPTECAQIQAVGGFACGCSNIDTTPGANPVCSPCEDGKVFSNPTGVVPIINVDCQTAYQMGLAGSIPESTCGTFTQFASLVCGSCVDPPGDDDDDDDDDDDTSSAPKMMTVSTAMPVAMAALGWLL